MENTYKHIPIAHHNTIKQINGEMYLYATHDAMIIINAIGPVNSTVSKPILSLSLSSLGKQHINSPTGRQASLECIYIFTVCIHVSWV